MELYGILGPDWQTVKKAGNLPKRTVGQKYDFFGAETEELEDSLEAWKGSFCGSPADSEILQKYGMGRSGLDGS